MRIQKLIEELCIFKNRVSSSENEYRAARHIYQLMRSIGLVVNIDVFKSQQRYAWELSFITTFFLTQAILYFIHPLASIIVGLTGFVLFWGHFTTRFKPLSSLFRFSKSHNVVGRSQNSDAPFKIIFTAHYDTARSGPLWNPKNVGKFRFNFLLGLFVILALQLLSVLSYFEISNIITTILVALFGVHILGQIIVLIYSGITGEPVQGASDNASGAAVMLDLATRIKKKSFPEIEFWFVATGSEEVGAIGMADFLKTYSDEFEKENTFFINFDNIGSGNLHYYLGEGMLNFYKFSPKLIYAAQRTSENEKLKQVTPAKYKLAYTDAIVPASRGYETILFLATDDNDQIPNWHWHTDTIENINYKIPKLTSDFCLEMIQTLHKDFKQIIQEDIEKRKQFRAEPEEWEDEE
ncbi:M28 family peptidase [candidate division KSB1 bacterium]|nr:M28 family peptidase [candidate division KSB1 bacterium]MBL7095182.1 M28 family peptidase [candidate division KSB1 bacterium]